MKANKGIPKGKITTGIPTPIPFSILIHCFLKNCSSFSVTFSCLIYRTSISFALSVLSNSFLNLLMNNFRLSLCSLNILSNSICIPQK